MAKLNITWAQFAICNDNPTKAFEDMCRRLFRAEFLKKTKRPHSNHNNPGVEVLPVLEPEREDGLPRKRISFQSKFVSRPVEAYREFQKSAKVTIKKYKNQLDLVYLFCNQTLTTTSSGYKAIEKIHDEAEIETYPISGDELLDMVSDYTDIAEYFFQNRIVADTTGLQPTLVNGTQVYFVPIDKINQSEDAKEENENLIQELIGEKLDICRCHAIALEMNALEIEVNRLISSGVSDDSLYYYQFLLVLRDGRDTEKAINQCKGQLKKEAEWLLCLYNNPSNFSVEEFKEQSTIAQVFAVDRLFSSGHWDVVRNLYEIMESEIDSSISNQFMLFYGLSLLNLQEDKKAQEILHDLYENTREERVLFYDVCANIRIENRLYQSGMKGRHDVLANLLVQLDTMKDLGQDKYHELFVAGLKMESYYHLALAEKTFLDKAIALFGLLSDVVRNNIIIQYYYALCLEMNGERDRAIGIYEHIDWKTNFAIAERYMICLILNKMPEKAIEVYRSFEESSIRMEALYILALERSNSNNYSDELRRAVEKYKDKPESLFQIVYFTDSESSSRDITIPVLREVISKKVIYRIKFQQQMEIITFLAHCREIELLETALGAVRDISVMNSFVVGQIYLALYDIAYNDYSRKEKNFEIPRKLEVVEKIADGFLNSNVFRKLFLQIKVLCAGAKNTPYSFLKYSKELFDITHDAEMARNIVAVLFEQNEKNATKYEPYINILKQSDNPDHAFVVANAMLLLEKEETAELYAYKSLYLLNGKDDYHIYRGYISFWTNYFHRFHTNVSIQSVKSGMVVTLQEHLCTDPYIFEICLDNDLDFYDEMNRSMEIEHITTADPEYIKLRGCGVGNVLFLRNRKYRIIQIQHRSQFALGFILRKIQENPEMFRGVAWMITVENVDDMINQVKGITDHFVQTDSLLDSYHFINNEAGLPIDVMAAGDYSHYIAAFKYLLYQKDEALYTGQPVYKNEEGQKYVIGLSTLVLLAIMGRMDVLDAIKNHIVIPESYLSFFHEEYSRAAGIDQLSKLTLYYFEGQYLVDETDKTVSEIWEEILRFCRTCKTQQITDQERIDYNIVQGLSGERFITGFRLNVIQLDALLLSKREKATYLCDDLFFHKIAEFHGIRNLNIASLIQHYTNLDYRMSFVKQLSKTNYIYTPLQGRTSEEFLAIMSNLFDGEKKKLYYGDLIKQVLNRSK